MNSGINVIFNNNELMDVIKICPHRLNDMNDVAEDLYSHQYGHLETIKTISNTGTIVTKNIIIPNIVPVTLIGGMIIFCIRDSLREYKSNYVILSTMKLSLYN
jgi:hypothetical protein